MILSFSKNRFRTKVIDLVFKFLANSNFILTFFQRCYFRLKIERSVQKDKNFNLIYGLLKNDKVVLNGPFKGLKYVDAQSVGSQWYPKILGSYEYELHDEIRRLPVLEYTEIIDIGCAEGYYAVGFGLINNTAKIHAYDINPEARQLCIKMSELNGIRNRLVMGEFFTSEDLRTFNFTGKGLIICDCEGYERQIFNSSNIDNLINCDLIIELHDICDLGVSVYVKNLFKETHNLQSVYSIDDIQKVFSYEFPELQNLNLSQRKELLSEGRGAIMEWLICKSK